MDVLSDVLRAVRLTGAVFFDVEASAPWVAATPAAVKIATSVMPEAEHVIMFHAVTSGGCWAELEDGSVPPVRLAAGDIVIMPMGDQHVLCSTPGLRAEADLNVYVRPTDRQLPFGISVPGGSGERTRFVCGYLGCDARPFNPVLQALPPIFHARAAEGAGCMAQLLRLAIDETMQYLTRWRMQLATRLLERQGVGLAQVAAEVGYELEAAFNRAFKKCVGAPPGAWRRGRQALGQAAAQT